MLKTKEPKKKANAENTVEKETKKSTKKATKVKTDEKKAVKEKKPKKEKKVKEKAPKERKPNFFVDMIKGFVISSASNTEKATEKKRFPLLAIGTTAIATVLFLVIVASFMQISQIQAEMKIMESNIRELRAEERKLSMELEGRYSSKIESVAADMGLSGKYHPTYYIESKNDGETEEIVENEAKEETTKNNSLLNAISRSFSKFIEFID